MANNSQVYQDFGSISADSEHHQEEPLWGPRHNSDDRADSPWARKVVLSLDGGGVRGFSSLLILERLMEKIRDIESQQEPKSRSSYASTWTKPSAHSEDEDYFVHHYVDYFFGTSTGGLSAIMLGRLKMTVAKSMDLYQIIGERVFKHARKLAHKQVKYIYPAFNSGRMEKAMREATVLGKMQSDAKTKMGTAYVTNESAEKTLMRDENQESSRTVAVACLKNGPYLFRSYDHPEPAPGLVRPQRSSAGPGSDGLHLNPGPASDIPVWKVGRATSAAPGWFEPMIIDEEVFLDGAVARSNNPVEIAYNEVKQLSPMHEPKIVISIGTNAKAPKDSPVAKRTNLFITLGMIIDAVKSFKDSILASRKRHQDFMSKHQLSDHEEQTASDDKAMYFRFDVPDSLPFEGVRLGDWKGENGSATKGAIRGPTYQYLNQASTRAKLLRCARELVAIRRQRARTARWESFAFDARLYYLCPEKDNSLACQALRFDSRYHLRQHAFERHGFARRVPCIYHGTVNGVPPIIKWTCSKDDCEEQIQGFDTEDDFTIHLQSHHDTLVPRLADNRAFESWLDSGRQQLDADETRKPTRRTTVDWAK